MKLKESKKTVLIVLGVVILGILALSALNRGSGNTIEVSGTATIDVLPDLVSVYFSVDTTGATNKEASDKNSEIVNELKSSLVVLGFEESEIQTQSFNIYPNYDYRTGQQVNGYRATHSLKVEMSVEQSNTLGEVVDAGINAGAGIGYINFELTQENQNKYKAEAIQIAAQDAQIKAQAVADGFNKRLGRLVSTSLDSYDYIPWVAYASDGAGAEQAREAATNIQPSEQSVSARVTAVFKLI